MTRLDYSKSFPSFRPSSGQQSKTRRRQQQIACDRCRGQKLRCIRSSGFHVACDRCQKAGATCVTDPSVRMGRRPRHADRDDNDANARRGNLPQQAHEPGSPLPPSRRAASHTSLESLTTDASIWHGSDIEEETVVPALSGVQYAEPVDFRFHGAGFDGANLHTTPPDDCFSQHGFDFLSAHTPRNVSDILMNGLQSEGANNAIHAIADIIPVDPLAANGTAAEASNNEQGIPEPQALPSVSILQESIEKVSNLNLELLRQLAAISETANEYNNTELSQMTPPSDNSTISSTIVFMIHGLQTFHELLLDILGSQSQNSPHDAAGVNTLEMNKEQATLQQGFWQTLTRRSSTLLRLTYTRQDLASDGQPESTAPLQATGMIKPVDHVFQESGHQISFLDVSSSLLVMSCYINLIRLCRDVFACISATLPARRRHASLLALSCFQISGVSVHQDSDLQLIVLTQVVVRLVDSIGIELGYPCGGAAKADKGGDGRKAILPNLVDFVLRQDGKGHSSCSSGIEALRKEIRKLNDVIYKFV